MPTVHTARVRVQVITPHDHGIPLLPGTSPSSLWAGLPANLSFVGFHQNTLTPLPLPSNSTTAQLQSTRGHPTAEPQSPVGQLTMQGVGQHAGHALHHHLVGGLQEREGDSIQPASRLGITGELRAVMGENLGPCGPHLRSVYLRWSPLSPTPNFLHPGGLLGPEPGPMSAQGFLGFPAVSTMGPLLCPTPQASMRMQL